MSYEEGGSNGLTGEEVLSSVALILTCDSTGGDPIEAWCIPLHVDKEISALCISSDLLGAGFLCTDVMLDSKEAFDPLLITVTRAIAGITNGIEIEFFSLTKPPLVKESLFAPVIVEFNNDDPIYEAPTMAMGSSPSVLCLCWKVHVIIIVRERGLLLCYRYLNNNIILDFEHKFERYVIDAGIQTSEDGNLEITSLICESDKDGRVIIIRL